MAKVLCVLLVACIGVVLGQYPNHYQGSHYGPNSGFDPYGPRGPQGGAYGGQLGVSGGQNGPFNGQQFARYGGQQIGSFGRSSGSNVGQYDNSEPANYEFGYQVQDPQSRVGFGHQEQRQGDFTQGNYHVLLPDGRTQVVEYTADHDGYRPLVSYHDHDFASRSAINGNSAGINNDLERSSFGNGGSNNPNRQTGSGPF